MPSCLTMLGLAFIHLNLSAEYPFIYCRLADIRTNTDRLHDIRYDLVVRVSCTHGKAYPYRVDRPFSNFKRLHIGRIICGCHVRLRAWYCVPIWRYHRGCRYRCAYRLQNERLEHGTGHSVHSMWSLSALHLFTFRRKRFCTRLLLCLSHPR